MKSLLSKTRYNSLKFLLSPFLLVLLIASLLVAGAILGLMGYRISRLDELELVLYRQQAIWAVTAIIVTVATFAIAWLAILRTFYLSYYLQKNLSLVNSTFEATADGLLAIDRKNKILTVNGKFAEMWSIPPDVIESGDTRRVNDCILRQLKNPEIYLSEIDRTRGTEIVEEQICLELKNGSIYECYAQPQVLDGRWVGQVLNFRDVTQRCRAEIERQVMFEISEGINSTANLDSLLELTHQAVAKVLYAENFFVALYDSKEDLLSMEFFVDKFDESPSPFRLGKGQTAYIFRSGRPMLMNREMIKQLTERGEIELKGTPPAAWLGVPLNTKSEVIGVMVVQSYEDEQAFSNSDLEFLASVGNQVAVAIERKLTEEALQESQKRYQHLFDSNPYPIMVYDTESLKILAVNHEATNHYGYDREEFLRLNMGEIRPPDEVSRFLQLVEDIAAVEDAVNHGRHLKKDGTVIEVEVASQAITFDGAPARLALITDITERKRSEAALRESEYKLRTLLESMTEGLVQVANDNTVEFVNERFCEMTGYLAEEVMGESFEQLLLDEDNRRLVQEATQKRLKGISSQYELCVRKKTGESLWVIVGASPIINADGFVTGSMGVFTDITERKSTEERLLHDALHDGLTGLANRTLFINHLQMTITRGLRHTQNQYAVLFLDFDRFKVINDSLGHAEGDNLLKQIARRLETSLRGGDMLARLGGDEFTILLNELVESNDAIQVAERILKDLNAPFILGDQEIFMSASIGIALCSSGHQNADEMLRDADIAMYRAKAKGKAQYQVFDSAMHRYALNKLQLETEMHHALQRGEFCLNYQPIVNLETDTLMGFEALIRWDHPERGMVSPADFIPMAEENGLVVPLGRWILFESCRQLRQWQLTNPSATDLSVSVNLSSKQFLQSDLVEQVHASLISTQLDPRCLKLEITESHLMENSEKSVTMMNRLRALGIQICLDDFGTGYSSLSYLHRLPVNFLKIDRSFVYRMVESKENGEIVHTIVKLAQNLKMKVIAEGIETIEQVAKLRLIGCEYGQGYFISQPLKAEAVAEFIDNRCGNGQLPFNQKIMGAEVNV